MWDKLVTPGTLMGLRKSQLNCHTNSETPIDLSKIRSQVKSSVVALMVYIWEATYALAWN